RTGRGDISSPDDPLEREADTVADRVDRGELGVTAGPAAPSRVRPPALAGVPAPQSSLLTAAFAREPHAAASTPQPFTAATAQQPFAASPAPQPLAAASAQPLA